MKITDLSLIFIGVILPLIIVVYINVSFTIKAQEQEVYYQQIIDSAVQDATNEMKQVENEDSSIDYGYSGTENKKRHRLPDGEANEPRIGNALS